METTTWLLFIFCGKIGQDYQYLLSICWLVEMRFILLDLIIIVHLVSSSSSSSSLGFVESSQYCKYGQGCIFHWFRGFIPQNKVDCHPKLDPKVLKVVNCEDPFTLCGPNCELCLLKFDKYSLIIARTTAREMDSFDSVCVLMASTEQYISMCLVIGPHVCVTFLWNISDVMYLVRPLWTFVDIVDLRIRSSDLAFCQGFFEKPPTVSGDLETDCVECLIWLEIGGSCHWW